MSGFEIRQRAASEGQRGGRRGQEGQPAPLYRALYRHAARIALIFIPYHMGVAGYNGFTLDIC